MATMRVVDVSFSRRIFKAIFEGAALLDPYNSVDCLEFVGATDALAEVTDVVARRRLADNSYTIFEGTSEIQRLVVARAVSGLHIP
jgi:alkylation response protein AidB-like acyl-CoA dehydrogenase